MMGNKRIFISSTCFDLIDLRAELKDYIKSSGLIPVLSDHPETEFVTYKDHNSIETCLINLRNCSVVILILSQRYGPSLLKADFDDFSATHLEYKEAVENNIKTIVFVRDRLEADYNAYKKTGDLKALQWINEKQIRLFEIIEEHKTLSNSNKNNWYWPFKNSLEIKERLSIDLKDEISSNRLNFLIQNGKIPLTTVSAYGFKKDKKIEVKLSVTNLGSESAVDPILLIFKNKSYGEVLEGNLEMSALNYTLKILKSLLPGAESNTSFELDLEDIDLENGNCKIIIEIVYKTILGDLISDISELEINFQVTAEPIFVSRYTSKRYRGGSAYEQLTK